MSLILRRPKFDGPEGEPGDWIEEEKRELENPLYRTALELKPRIYVENLNQAANEELLDLGLEKEHMLHIALYMAMLTGLLYSRKRVLSNVILCGDNIMAHFNSLCLMAREFGGRMFMIWSLPYANTSHSLMGASH